VGALLWGCDVLERLTLRPDAPPVFLLDSNRMNGLPRQPGAYDNRWCAFPQDMPSAAFLKARGIREVHVRCAFIANDLTHILRRYKDEGLLIYHIDVSETTRKIDVVRPSYFRSLKYRLRTMAGLTRNAAGGFGGHIPEPSQASGGRYYGFG
jgi:hypothetical protein